MKFGYFGIAMLLASVSANAATFMKLYDFDEGPTAHSNYGLVADGFGSFLGVSRGSGLNSNGAIFKYTPGGDFATLHTFSGSDGRNPSSRLYSVGNGNFVGTTFEGGASDRGTIFRFNSSSGLTTLHSFSNVDGSIPSGRLIADSSGNLFGTTWFGPTGSGGNGSIFRLNAGGGVTTLHAFSQSDGNLPMAGVVANSNGTLFGTTAQGGAHGRGTIFSLDTSNVFTTLHSFSGSDGERPEGTLLLDLSGNLVGTTSFGGSSGSGTIFRFNVDNGLDTLHNFSFVGTGAHPQELIADAAGNLFGTTKAGGSSFFGTVFRLNANGGLTTLHTFNATDGAAPGLHLTSDTNGNIFGTTNSGGGSNAGVIFRISDVGFVSDNPPLTPMPIPVPTPPAPSGLTLEGVEGFDPSRPTVVITHGWQPPIVRSEWQQNVADAINGLNATIGDVNIIRAYWDDANTPAFSVDALRSATAQVSSVGIDLASRLKGLLGGESDFAGGIQFIGHSLGSLVNAYAANALVKAGVDIDQFTILDRPFGQGIRTDSIFRTVGGDSDQFIFRLLLPGGDVAFVDNYFGLSRSNTPFGAGATGASFAPDAQALDYGVAGANHSGVHEFYLGTIGSGCLDFGGAGFGCSLAGGSYSLAADLFPWDPNPSSLTLPSTEVILQPVQWLTFNCEINGLVSVATCNERSPAYLWMSDFTFDPNAEFLSFEFAWHDVGDGDWLTLHFDDMLLYNGNGSGFERDQFFSSGFLTVGDLAGRNGQLLFSLNSVGAPNASFSIRNIVAFNGVAAVPESGTWTMLIAGFGFVGMGLRLRRRQDAKEERSRCAA